MRNRKLYATFVLPAPNGCNLKCPFCAIAQRGEATRSRLGGEDYVRFLSDILAGLAVTRVSIQGYEPLLPEAWPLTERLLRLANAYFCETSVVTNGTYLAEHAGELGRLVDTATVSLDSDQAAVHDRLRGVAGAHEQALNGLRAAQAALPGRLNVNSVLFPNRAEYLNGMPKLLAQLGIKEWVISPMISFRQKGYIPKLSFIKKEMARLADEAESLGVNVLLSDELRTTEETDLFETLSIRSLEAGDAIFRLSPDGSCSRGREILGSAGAVPMWDTAEQPAKFVKRIFAEFDSPLRMRRAPVRTLLARYANMTARV